MPRAQRFWDRIAEKYAKKPIADQATYEKKLEIARAYLNTDMNVLEFGCGTGSTALTLASCVSHIRAVDFSANMIRAARAKTDAANIDNVSFEQSSFDDLEVVDSSLDAVLAMSVLHLLEDWEEVIASVFRMLKADGVFISSTACIGDMAGIFQFILPVGYWLRLIPLVKVFSEVELVSELENAGFIVEYQWRPGKGKGVFIVARKPG